MRASLTRAINRFDTACQELAFKGSYHPNDWDGVEAEYAHARRLLEAAIEREAVRRAEQARNDLRASVLT